MCLELCLFCGGPGLRSLGSSMGQSPSPRNVQDVAEKQAGDKLFPQDILPHVWL